jgi:hypothetical protein
VKQAKALAAAQVVAEAEEAQEDEAGGKKKRRKVVAEEKDEKAAPEKEEEEALSDDEDSPSATLDSFARHYAASSNPLLPESLTKEALDEAIEKGGYWAKGKKEKLEAIGEAVVFAPKDAEGEAKVEGSMEGYNEKLVEKMKRLNEAEGKCASSFVFPFSLIRFPLTSHMPPPISPFALRFRLTASETPLSWLSQLSTYRDVLYPRLELGEAHEEIRQAASLHAMNHVLKCVFLSLSFSFYPSLLLGKTSSDELADRTGLAPRSSRTTSTSPSSPRPLPQRRSLPKPQRKTRNPPPLLLLPLPPPPPPPATPPTNPSPDPKSSSSVPSVLPP